MTPSADKPADQDAIDAALDLGLEDVASPPDAAGDLQKLQQQLDEANDRALRAHAEIDNVLRRARREVDEERKYANLPLLRDLLPVVDNLRRAIEAAAKAEGDDAGTMLAGVKMVAQQFEQTLERHQCQQITALHEPFDPHLHQAISQQPSAEHPANTIVLVVQEGYRLHDRVIRPAQVIVSTTPQT